MGDTRRKQRHRPRSVGPDCTSDCRGGGADSPRPVVYAAACRYCHLLTTTARPICGGTSTKASRSAPQFAAVQENLEPNPALQEMRRFQENLEQGPMILEMKRLQENL